uniref:ENT domain-containing protein n=1 Tax=Cannabis sativa TaxID=3483 RepID=A0A803NX11_CANSA
MRFRKGSKVEVLSKKEMPSGSWQCAEIISGNGHNYNVRYDGLGSNTVVERVSRKDIRPCPPSLDVSDDFLCGDVVEFFHNFSWKMATILKVLGTKYVLLRLVGSSQEYKATKLDIRVRQSWQDDQWIVIGKESQFSSSKTPKRGFSYCNSQADVHARTSQKCRVVDNGGICHRVFKNHSVLAEQADAALPRDMQGEKELASFNIRRTCLPEVSLEKKQSGNVGYSVAVNRESDDTNSIASSVGSCSISSNNYYSSPGRVTASPVVDLNYNNAESLCHSRYEDGNCLLPRNNELADEIHRLELHAYRCTIEVLHASGPLSWEQEELMTNLRLSLHISNDEHLLEIRNLVSADTSVHLR